MIWPFLRQTDKSASSGLITSLCTVGSHRWDPMSTVPSPTVSRGDLTLQPAYFTSSLFVNPLREDISHLIRLFAEKYLTGDLKEPFALFKKIWAEQGWSCFHFKVFDARSREKFVTVTLRLFAGAYPLPLHLPSGQCLIPLQSISWKIPTRSQWWSPFLDCIPSLAPSRPHLHHLCIV